jgi:hypothetical protein
MVPTFGAETMSDFTTVEVVAKLECKNVPITIEVVAKGERENVPTAIEPVAKRTRKGTVLTDRLCETKVTKRKKYYDRRTRGLNVSITPAGIATFSCNFTDAAGRPTSRTLGVYHPETFKVAHARRPRCVCARRWRHAPAHH